MTKKKVMQEFPLPTRPIYPWIFCKYDNFFQQPIFFKISWPAGERDIRLTFRHERVVSCSPDGCWLLLAESADVSTEFYSAFNPTTMEYIHLPSVYTLDLYIESGVFSSSPTDPNCLIMLFVLDEPLIFYCRVGHHSFSRFNYEESLIAQTGRSDVQSYWLRRPVAGIDGKIYAIGSCHGDLVQITVDELNNCNTTLLNPNPNPFGSSDTFPSRFTHTGKFLVALGDHDIFQIHIACDILEFAIYKFNFVTNAWESKTSLNGRTIFLSPEYSLSVDDTPNKDGSYIYFTDSTYDYSSSADSSDDETLYNDETLHSYRVEDKRMSYFPPVDLPSPFCYELYTLTGDTQNQTNMRLTMSVAKEEDDLLEHCCTMSVAVTMSLGKEDFKHYCLTMPVAKEDLELCFTMSVAKQEDLEHCFPMYVVKEDLEQCFTMSVSEQLQKNWSSSSSSVSVGILDSSRMSISGQPLLCCLSNDLLGLIAGKLSLVDYINFRCVNRVCASGTIRMRMNPFPPSLIYCDRAKGVYNIVDSKLNQKLSVKIPDVLKDYKIQCSKNGWLLMENNGAMAFFNPFTMETVPGPKCKESFKIANFTFLSKPSCSDCDVMVMSRITLSTGRFLGIYTAQPRIGEWREFILQRLNQPKFRHGCISPVFLNGSCYYLGKDGRLGCFRSTKDGGFEWQVPIQLTVPSKPSGQEFLTECGGNLVSIFVDRRGVLVFKLSHDYQRWEHIDRLGSYSIYLSCSSSISTIAEQPDLANRIYFPRFYKNGLVYYSLNTEKFYFHSIGSQDSLSDLFGTNMYCDCAWIEPSWS